VGRSYDTLVVDVADSGVATIALDQPETRNALSDAVLGDLLAAFEQMQGDDAVRCVVLASTRLGKDALWRQTDLPLEDAWDFLRSQLTLAFSTHDMREGVAAFFEKREPVWAGR
jgi:enoyl-CoA hydratase/carnithine racemase